MPDDDRLQIVLQDNIFKPSVSDDQHRLAVRYDALRSALGKFGRPFSRRTSLILPAPLLLLHRDEVWEPPGTGDRRSRQAWLVFLKSIQEAHSVTLWDPEGRPVGTTYRFAANKRIPVEDPGVGGSVEVRDSDKVTLMVGVPVRMFDIEADAETIEE